MAKLLYSAGEAGAAHPGGTGCQIEGHGVYLCSTSPHFFLAFFCAAFGARGGFRKSSATVTDSCDESSRHSSSSRICFFSGDVFGVFPCHAEKKDGAGQVEPFCGFANDHAESFMRRVVSLGFLLFFVAMDNSFPVWKSVYYEDIQCVIFFFASDCGNDKQTPVPDKEPGVCLRRKERASPSDHPVTPWLRNGWIPGLFRFSLFCGGGGRC